MNAVEISDLVKIYDNKFQALNHINLSIPEGSFFGLLGPNGAGKSVTFNVLLGIMKANQGNVFVEGTRITDFSIHERAKKFRIGYIPQNDSVFKGLTCEDNLRAIAEITLKDRAKQESVIQELLSEFNLSHLKNIKADNLSGGERKKLVIARALVNEPEIILADEPTGSLDHSTAKEVFKILYKLKDSNRLIIYATHNRFFANMADCKLEMINGSIKTINVRIK